MKQELEEFIDERINKNSKIVRNSEKWQELNKEYIDFYEKLNKELTKELQEKLQELMSIKDTLIGCEYRYIYQLGKNDTLELMKRKIIL